MKKFFICLILISIALPSQAFSFSRKNKELRKEFEGKGYAGTLPKLEEKFENQFVSQAKEESFDEWLNKLLNN